MLTSFNTYLDKKDIPLRSLKIEHLDAFMRSFTVKNNTRKLYRTILRGFVRYLYYQKGIIKKDLASLLVSPRLIEDQKPPKFLRPREVKSLFSNLKLSTPADIRIYAMVYLAYSLGLRPVEISLITFDDISFSEGCHRHSIPESGQPHHSSHPGKLPQGRRCLRPQCQTQKQR